MILYFDNYITDTPFHKGGHETLGEVRNSNAKIYHMPSKLDITLYTLSSYENIKFSKVIIKYELENKSQKKRFEKEVLKIFPRAKLIYGRGDTQDKFKESIKLMDKIRDEWIFYAGNNDHPFIASNTKVLNSCLKKAEEYSKKSKFVSIAISHFTEFYGKVQKGSPFREIRFYDSKILEENDELIVAKFPRGLNHSMQIVNKKLFKHWFESGDSKGIQVRRSECMEPFIQKNEQIVIIPKQELCAHFDGEVPTSKSAHGIPYDLCPPLFIPPGFFKNNVKIRYGYDKYRDGWVNINPLKKNYSFKDSKNGTDMKIILEDTPLFWKKRIKKLDRKTNLDIGKINLQDKLRKEKIRMPFKCRSKAYFLMYRTRNKIYKQFYKTPQLRKVSLILLKNKRIKNLYKKSYNAARN